MINRGHAGNEIGRLIGLNYFPTDRKAVAELVTALSFARNEIIATAVINDWLESSSERPTPADIRRLVANHNEGAAARQPVQEVDRGPIRCAICRDWGIRETIQAADLRSVASYCDCSAGYLLRQKCCTCPENATGLCGRPLRSFDEECAGPPWRLNWARRHLEAMNGMASQLKKIEPLRLTPQDDYHGDF